LRTIVGKKIEGELNFVSLPSFFAGNNEEFWHVPFLYIKYEILV
jgi:hypothetical protein